MKFIIYLVIIGISFSAFGTNCDTNKVKDTVLLSQDKIQNIRIQYDYLRIPPQTSQTINSQAEFDEFFGGDCRAIPAVDFYTKTLLYFPTNGIGSCRPPDYIGTVKIIDKTVIYHVNIITYGGCFNDIFNSNCVAIPKIDSTYTVKFQKTITTMQDEK